MMKSTLVLSFIIGVSMLGQTAFAVELWTISSSTSRCLPHQVRWLNATKLGRSDVTVRWRKPIRVTTRCLSFSTRGVTLQAIGEEGLLAEAVRESVLNHEGQVHSLERGSRGGVALVDVGFTRGTVKGHGNARYLRWTIWFYEAVVLCIAGVRADPQFFAFHSIN